ncbi:MAG TPA: ATP-binding protein [Caulobacteraceae bacterium]
MDPDMRAALVRIAEALERVAPAAHTPQSFDGSRLFRHDPATGRFVPAPDYELFIDLLVGVERQKHALLQNLERFARGVGCNHVLLWGVRGAGKSSLAKAAFMTVAEDSPLMRLIEVDRDEVTALPALFETLRPLPERFVILCDDLSFEAGAAAAKALKSALEGGVCGPPRNTLLVATSNRRHLMARDSAENHGAIATAEDAEEEVSVSDRFGLWIGFPPMDQGAYLRAVRTYADHFGLGAEDLDRRALQWALQRGARSGRVAWQFIRELAGELGVSLPA